MSTDNSNVRTRRRFVRAVLCVVYVALIAFVFVKGKGHTLILDNKDSDDGSVKAVESLSVSVDGQDPIDLSSGDRDMAKVRGQNHRVEITIQGQKSATRITVPLKEDVVLLSLPKLLAGQPAVSKFVPKVEAPSQDQSGNSNAFTAPTSAAPSGASDAPVAPTAPAAPADGAAPVAP